MNTLHAVTMHYEMFTAEAFSRQEEEIVYFQDLDQITFSELIDKMLKRKATLKVQTFFQK